MDDLSIHRLDVDGALAEAAEPLGGVSRAGFLGASMGASLAMLGLEAVQADARQSTSDLDILNYALTLEYLQAAFYTESERMGALEGRTERAAQTVGAVERAHVAAFQDLLGNKAVKRPSFDFQGVTEKPQAFLKTAVAFEDLAVAAYKGQATNIKADRRSPPPGDSLCRGAPRGMDALPLRCQPGALGVRPAGLEAGGHEDRELDELRHGKPVNEA